MRITANCNWSAQLSSLLQLFTHSANLRYGRVSNGWLIIIRWLSLFQRRCSFFISGGGGIVLAPKMHSTHHWNSSVFWRGAWRQVVGVVWWCAPPFFWPRHTMWNARRPRDTPAAQRYPFSAGCLAAPAAATPLPTGFTHRAKFVLSSCRSDGDGKCCFSYRQVSGELSERRIP